MRAARRPALAVMWAPGAQAQAKCSAEPACAPESSMCEAHHPALDVDVGFRRAGSSGVPSREEFVVYRFLTYVVSLLVKAFTVTGGSITGAREVPEPAGDRLASSTSSSSTV